MALLKKIQFNKHTILYIWHVVETEQELIKNLTLTPYCKMRLLQMKIHQHRCNFLAVRQILLQEGFQASDLMYNHAGKPFLSEGCQHISITHSNKYVSVAFSNTAVGVDIEPCTEKLLRVCEKFTHWNAHKSHLCKHEILLKLCKIWTAKEAMYKIHNQKGLDLKKQICLDDFSPFENEISGKILTDKNHSTHYKIHFLQEIENYIISLAFPIARTSYFV